MIIIAHVVIITTTSAIFKVEDEVEIMGKVTESVLEGHCDVKHLFWGGRRGGGS